MTSRILLASATVCIFFRGIAAADESVNCPETIAVSQQLTAPIAGWTTMLDDMSHRLAGITFYDGPPEEKASLVNDQTTRVPGKEVATWRFAEQTDRRIWIACSYAGTAILLKRALPPKTASCTVTYNSRQSVAGLPLIEKVTCK